MAVELLQRFLPHKDRELIVPSPEPLQGQATELWRAIAPKRKPNSWETAILYFNFGHPSGVRPENPQQQTFVSLLRRYSPSINPDGRPFETTLSVNSWAVDDISFRMTVWAPTPPELHHPILTFTELPQREEYKPMHYPYNLLIEGEGEHTFTQESNYELVGQEVDGRLIWQEIQERDDWSSVPIGDVSWRRKFASEALTFLTRVANQVDPETAAVEDKCIHASLERSRKRAEAQWKAENPRWKHLFAPTFAQSRSIKVDNLNLFLQRRQEQSFTKAAEFLAERERTNARLRGSLKV